MFYLSQPQSKDMMLNTSCLRNVKEQNKMHTAINQQKLLRKEIIINAPFPTKACGHIEQTFLIDEYKDDLHARIIAIKDKELYIHISLDLLGLKEKICQKIKDIVTDIYGDVHVIVSTTHTHYGNDVEDDRSRRCGQKRILRLCVDLDFCRLCALGVDAQLLACEQPGRTYYDRQRTKCT